LFLPRANEMEARARVAALGAAATGIELRFIESTTAKPREALRAILLELESPPTRRDGWNFEDRASYHRRMSADRAERYYVEELLDDVVDRLMPRVLADHRLQGINRLVLVASTSPGGAFLLRQLFDPAEVLVVHDDELPDGQPVVAEPAGRLQSLPRAAGGSRQVQTVDIAAGEDFETRLKRSVDE